jgi:6-phosphofructokinase 1
MKRRKRIAVLCSGGDAPGMNAAVRSVVRCAIYRGCEVFGIIRGYEGLINSDIIKMGLRSVSNILPEGGTIIKTARSKEFMTRAGQRKAVDNLNERRIDGLIVIGGNGSFRGAHLLATKWGVRTVGIPATIDNDIMGSDMTIGADTAVNTALGAIDKIRDTVSSMERIYVVEVMGRKEGYIAIRVGLTGGAEDILVPHSKYTIERMCEDIERGRQKGKRSWIIVVAEGVATAKDVADRIHEVTGHEVRSVTLGHIQRGGSPTAYDRMIASRLGAAAVDALLAGATDKMIGIVADKVVVTSFAHACKQCQGKRSLDRELYKLTRILAT